MVNLTKTTRHPTDKDNKRCGASGASNTKFEGTSSSYLVKLSTRRRKT